AVAATVDRSAAEVLRLRATGTVVVDVGQVRRQPVTAALHAVPVGGHRGLETVAAIEGCTQVAERVLAQCARTGAVVLVQVRNTGQGADQAVAVGVGGEPLRRNTGVLRLVGIVVGQVAGQG